MSHCLKLPFGCMREAHRSPTQAWIQTSIKVSLIAVKQAWIQKQIKVSLITVHNIIVVTYCNKWHRLSLSLIAYCSKWIPTSPHRSLSYSCEHNFSISKILRRVLLPSNVGYLMGIGLGAYCLRRWQTSLSKTLNPKPNLTTSSKHSLSLPSLPLPL